MFLKLSKTRVTLYLGLLWQSLPKCQRVWCFCQDSVVCTLLPFPPPRPCSSPKQEQDPAPQMSHLLHEMTDTGRWGGKLVGRSLNTEEDYMLTCISISSAAIMLKQEPFCLRKSNRISKHFKSSEEHLSRWFSVEKANLEASLKQLSVTENKTKTNIANSHQPGSEFYKGTGAFQRPQKVLLTRNSKSTFSGWRVQAIEALPINVRVWKCKLHCVPVWNRPAPAAPLFSDN